MEMNNIANKLQRMYAYLNDVITDIIYLTWAIYFRKYRNKFLKNATRGTSLF